MVYDEDRIGQLNLVFNDEDKVLYWMVWAVQSDISIWYRIYLC